ncbi:MAG: class I SAM-dependent methyltransferase [Candidatus Auribacterota bacterium]|nr:class I SAM-dependent methyltransferase [Candidatus Auribacterota bacterium]
MKNISQKDIESFADSLLKLFDDIKHSDLMNKGPDYHPCSKELYNADRTKLITRIRFFQRILEPIKERSEILEIGSGYGFNLIIIKFLGFESVYGVELVESVSDTAEKIIKLAKKHVDFDLTGCRSICANAETSGFDDQKFQNILAIESISHVPSFDRLMREINRILKTGGNFIVSDGNNICCPPYRKFLHKTWEKTRKNELEKKIDYLKKVYPDLSPHLRASIALHTELLSLKDAADAVPNILKTNKLPMNLYFEGYAPIQVQSGTWAEYAFEPPKLAKYMSLYGFSATPKLYAGSARGGIWPVVEDIINVLPDKIRFLFRPTFLIYMKKIDAVKYLVN